MGYFNEIENKILDVLYVSWFKGEVEGNLQNLLSNSNWEPNEFWKFADKLSHDEYIEPFASGGLYIITTWGIIASENHRIAPENMIVENQNARTLILDNLMTVYDEGNSHSDKNYKNICSETEISEKICLNNIQVLEGLGFVESTTMGSLKITYDGINAVKKWRTQKQIADEFEDMKNLNPHKRGMAFQKIFPRILESNEWRSEEGVRTSNEEIDVIFSKEREFYLLECKWEKDPVEASIIRELYGKLSNRIEDVKGIIASMSGFASGAEKQAIEYANKKVILFFGPQDISSIMYDCVTFDELLNEKYKILITRKKLIYN